MSKQRLNFIRREQVRQRDGYLWISIHHTAEISSTADIGGTGCGYERGEDGELEEMPHLGGVKIGPYVKVGPMCSVQRGAFTDTVLGEGTVLGIGVNIGHGCRIGRNVLIIDGACVLGSVIVRDNVTIGGEAVIRPKVEIGEGAVIGDGALVLHDVPAGMKVKGLH